MGACVVHIMKRPLIREDLNMIQYQSQKADNTFITSDGTSPYNPIHRQGWVQDRVTRRKLRMAQDSDDLFVVNVVVWVLVVILAIVALHCPLSRRVVR